MVKKNTFIISLVSVSVILAVVSVLVFGWMFLKVHSTIGKVAFASEEAQLLAIKNAHTQTVRRVVRDTQLEREELRSYFVTEEEIVVFLEDIENLGAHAGAPINVQSVGVGKPIDKDKLLTPLELTVKNKGTLQEVFYTLTLLETFPKALRVEGVRLTQHPTEYTWSGTFDIVVIKVEDPAEK